MEKVIRDKHSQTLVGIIKYLEAHEDLRSISSALISKVFNK